MSPTLQLYHYWRSSCSWRVRWALTLKGVPYESIAVNLLKNEHKTPEFLSKNPSGLLPCLAYKGRYLSDSFAIIEWLEEIYPQHPLLPVDPWNKAKVREFSMVVAAGIQPIQNLKVLNYYSEEAAKRSAWAKHFIEEGLFALEQRLSDSSRLYCFDQQLTMADLFLIPQVYNALRFEIDMQAFPKAKSIYEHCLTTPACELAAPHNQPGAQ